MENVYRNVLIDEIMQKKLKYTGTHHSQPDVGLHDLILLVLKSKQNTQKQNILLVYISPGRNYTGNATFSQPTFEFILL